MEMNGEKLQEIENSITGNREDNGKIMIITWNKDVIDIGGQKSYLLKDINGIGNYVVDPKRRRTERGSIIKNYGSINMQYMALKTKSK